MDIKNIILESLSEGEGAVDFLLREISYKDIEHILRFLLNEYADQKNLLHQFWQRSSDACPLECIEYENECSEFEKFIIARMTK